MTQVNETIEDKSRILLGWVAFRRCRLGDTIGLRLIRLPRKSMSAVGWVVSGNGRRKPARSAEVGNRSNIGRVALELKFGS